MKRKSVLLISVLFILMFGQGLEISRQQYWKTSDRYICQGGRNIDVFTQRGGKGHSVSSDPFGPKEMVILYTYVTYNEYPMQNKLVTFEVWDPHDDIVSLLFAITNESGIATSSFRLPWLPDEPEEYFGIWRVVSAVEIAEEIVDDIVEFECGFFDVAIIDAKSSKTIVGKRYTVLINVTVENQGVFTETFNVTVYANTTVIETQKVNNMLNRTSTILTFTWNTTYYANGNYTVSAHATPVSPEIDTEDNTFTNGQVRIVTPGDVNGDGIVNMVDIYTELILRFMCKIGDECYNPNSDINDDGIINMVDIYITIIHFMEKEP